MAKRKGNEVKAVPLTKENLKGTVKIFKYMRPYLQYFILGMITLVLGSLIFMVLMGIPGEMANVAIGSPKWNLGLSINQFGLLLIVLLILQGGLSYLRTIYFTIVSEKSMADLRKDLYNKIISQEFRFFEERRVGELSSRLVADVEQLQSAFSVTLAEFIRQIIILVFGIAIIIYWTPKLSLIMLLTFPAIVILAMFFGKYIRKLSKERQDQLAETNTIVDETFQSFAVVKAFANEWYESIRYADSVKKIVDISLRFAKIRGLFFMFILTILMGGIFFVLWNGAVLLQEGKIEAGDLFSFIIYTGILGGAIASFGSLYTELTRAVGATERIQQILESDTEIDLENYKSQLVQVLKGKIDFDSVSFRYPSRPDVEVLKNVNMHIAAGSKVAIVGQSGAGKSTLMQLLMRFYIPTSGKITIDNEDIQSIDLMSLRKNIGIVPQEVLLFGGTIRENIGYGDPGADEEQILDAAEKSNCMEFISQFPEGLDTIVGERGVKLSGGQRQRIAIARAILKDPSILLLDEATSSLDAESEKIVQDALEKLMENRTSIIIAHRLATVKDVDQIFVLESGKIVEVGTHDELTKNEGVYNKLARLQFEIS
ncbi:MAG TPA: ABC transporter transmembrane domain-containing protein [Saprospiraceae bacterium]|nr:ATP-binding cassette domain-containing protein [Saprospiraceae bacterium]HPQ20680.1 ABC transporter transmembrane domain-containing protein [Saprospiraceae bacterium]